MRSTNHPLVRTIVKALDRAEETERRLCDPNNGAFRCTAGSIVEFGNTCERFSLPDHQEDPWTFEGIRAVVVAIAVSCPERELRWMATEAKKQIKWCEWWESVGYAEAHEVPTSARAEGN